jgi:hypothetical protein
MGGVFKIELFENFQFSDKSNKPALGKKEEPAATSSSLSVG